MSDQRTRSGRTWVLGALGGLLVAGGATYGVGYAMAGDKLPRNARVDGVAVGGVDEATATQRLHRALDARASAPITLTGAGKTTVVTPSRAGMSVDYAATVSQAGAGKSLDPRHIWNVLRGGGDLTPVVRVDRDKLAAAVAQTAPAFARTPVEATVSIKDTRPVTTPSRDGTALDQQAAATALRKAYLATTRVAAPIDVQHPDRTTGAARQLADEKLTPLLSGITVRAGGKAFTIGPKQAAAVTSVTPDGQTWRVAVDGAQLFDKTAADRRKAGLTGGRDATWTIADGRPKLVPAQDGLGIKGETFAKLVVPALLTRGTDRHVDVPVEKTEPDLTTAEAAKLGVKEVTGEFTTYFPYAEYRNINLSIAAAKVDGTFVRPGETFSMNNTIGPRTADSGFVDGWVISGDHLVKENAGGISQSGTTAFNALFFSGLQHIEHQPHSMYFDRYPAGREATLYYGHLDVKFRNDTPYGVLMQAYVHKASPGNRGSITVKVWSTKTYDVRSSDLVRSDYTYGRTIHRSGAECHAQAPSPGFTVNYSRLFYKGGKLVRSEPYRWTYAPTDEIICD